MKTLLLALSVLTLSLGVGNAHSKMPSRLGLLSLPNGSSAPLQSSATIPRLTLAPLPGSMATTVPSSPSEFAQLDTQKHQLPVSSGMIFGMVALFVLALRIMGLNHARAMADHERDSHHGKAEMFRSLHAERARR